MFAHPLHSIKLHQICERCDKKKEKTNDTSARLKEQIQQLHESLNHLKEADSTEEKAMEESDVEEMETPASPIKLLPPQISSTALAMEDSKKGRKKIFQSRLPIVKKRD
ncbi:hypothetical protein G7Y89_g4872 [Cudoniella acicularis]|uniref:Uncharacterized protein n=1 Tax=Cudoniella acicularis TaxID=354080 RepID=A0A8H4RNK5_9HELO|nr:hypothetical protein G7Y89_g4872 [Cudoniella acicularis]